MSSVGGGLAVAVAAVAAAVGKAATRYHGEGGDQDMHPEVWDLLPLGLQGKGKEVGATVAVKVSGAFILFELVPAVCGEPEPRKLVVWYTVVLPWRSTR